MKPINVVFILLGSTILLASLLLTPQYMLPQDLWLFSDIQKMKIIIIHPGENPLITRIEELRKRFPEFSRVPDNVLAMKIYNEFFEFQRDDLSFQQFQESFGDKYSNKISGKDSGDSLYADKLIQKTAGLADLYRYQVDKEGFSIPLKYPLLIGILFIAYGVLSIWVSSMFP